MKPITAKRAIPFAAILLIVGAWAYFFVGIETVDPNTAYGVTWSDPYAEALGIDPQAGFTAVLADLNVKLWRIPAYWTEVEPQPGVFHFEALQKKLDAIAAHGGKAIVVVGATEPRWPECWVPDWAKSMNTTGREAAQVAYLKATFNAFSNHPALDSWQVENETSLVLFGQCKDQPKAFLRQEIALMKNLETQAFASGQRHPVITTDSGEFSTWLDFPGLTDGRGYSVYRKVTAPYYGVFSYDMLTPTYYQRKAALVAHWTGPLFVSEFQMEPWVLQTITTTPLAEQFKTLSLAQMNENFSYAERLHVPRVYFWGVEWWYWMKVKMGHPEFWETAKSFFASHS